MKNADSTIPLPAKSSDRALNPASAGKLLGYKIAALESLIQAQEDLNKRIQTGLPMLPVKELSDLLAGEIEAIHSLRNRHDDESRQLASVTDDLRAFSEGAVISPDAVAAMTGKSLHAQILPGRIAKLSDEINDRISALPIFLVPLRYVMIKTACEMHDGGNAIMHFNATGKPIAFDGLQREEYSDRYVSLLKEPVPSDIDALIPYADELVRRARILIEEHPVMQGALGGEIPEVRPRLVEMVGKCSCGCVRELGTSQKAG